MPEKPYIRLENVGKVYDTRNGTVEACADVSLDIREHEFVAFVGPSGCGKTTIMKMVAGLQSHTSGTITVGGRKVDRPQTDVGIVFQEAILLDPGAVEYRIGYTRAQEGAIHAGIDQAEREQGDFMAALRSVKPDAQVAAAAH